MNDTKKPRKKHKAKRKKIENGEKILNLVTAIVSAAIQLKRVIDLARKKQKRKPKLKGKPKSGSTN